MIFFLSTRFIINLYLISISPGSRVYIFMKMQWRVCSSLSHRRHPIAALGLSANFLYYYKCDERKRERAKMILDYIHGSSIAARQSSAPIRDSRVSFAYSINIYRSYGAVFFHNVIGGLYTHLGA